jgi:RNA polymerase sigma factor (sigma-70 family)
VQVSLTCLRGVPSPLFGPGACALRLSPGERCGRAVTNRGMARGSFARIDGKLAVKLSPIEGPEVTDAALVVAAVAGERSAMQALFERHAPMVNRLARRLLGPGVDPSDLVQDAFVEALLGIRRLKNGQAFQAWLCSIVVRTAQKVRRRRRLFERLGLIRGKPLELDGFCASTAPPDVVAELKAIYALLRALPVEMHVALVLRRVEGLSIEQIAARMQLSVSTVKRRLAAAESRLDVWMAHEEGRA